MSTNETPPSSEKDFLVYTGNKVPRIIRLAWTALTIFGIYYLAMNMLPDLKEWIARLQ